MIGQFLIRHVTSVGLDVCEILMPVDLSARFDILSQLFDGCYMYKYKIFRASIGRYSRLSDGRGRS